MTYISGSNAIVTLTGNEAKRAGCLSGWVNSRDDKTFAKHCLSANTVTRCEARKRLASLSVLCVGQLAWKRSVWFRYLPEASPGSTLSPIVDNYINLYIHCAIIITIQITNYSTYEI